MKIEVEKMSLKERFSEVEEGLKSATENLKLLKSLLIDSGKFTERIIFLDEETEEEIPRQKIVKVPKRTRKK